jgi:hypothetical protein
MKSAKTKSASPQLPKLHNTLPVKAASRKYDDDYPIHAFKLCLLGATNKMLAGYFNVVEGTIQKWCKVHYDFAEAVARGKKMADMEVAHSLYQSSLDRIVTLRQAVKCKEVYYDDNGKRVEKERVEVVTVEKHIPGDYRAQQFWLRNRAPEHWGFKHDDSGNLKPVVTIDLGAGQNPYDYEAVE